MNGKLNAIDISHYNVLDSGNWKRIRLENIPLVFVKATDGVYKDPAFESNFNNAGRTGAIVGAYHFFKPLVSAISQAKEFIDTVKTFFKPGDLLMIDLEDRVYTGVTPEQYAANVRSFVSMVYGAFNIKPFIYTGPDYWKTALGNNKDFNDCPLWIAAYTNNIPAVFGGWAAATMWQYTGTGFVLGKSPIDRDYFYGTIQDLWKIANLSQIGGNLNGSNKVYAVQGRLTELGYDTQGVDGIFGNNTVAALNKFQSAYNLPRAAALNCQAWGVLFGFQ